MENNEIAIIVWNRWTGKTMLTSIIIWANQSNHINFYANYKTNMKNCFVYDDLEDLKNKIKKDPKKKVLILDEAQKLLNSRRAMTDINLEMVRFMVESRKFGADIILVAQTLMSVDKQLREQADWVIDLEHDAWGNGVSVIAKVLKKSRNSETWEIGFFPVNIVSLDDMAKLMNALGVEYDTKEQAFLTNKKNKKDGWSKEI